MKHHQTLLSFVLLLLASFFHFVSFPYPPHLKVPLHRVSCFF